MIVVDNYDRVVEYNDGERMSPPPEHIMVTGPVSEKDVQFRRTLVFHDGVLGNILYLMHAQFPNGYKIKISRLGEGIIGSPFAYSVKYWTPKGHTDVYCTIHHLTDSGGLLGLFDFMRTKDANDDADPEDDDPEDEIILLQRPVVAPMESRPPIIC